MRVSPARSTTSFRVGLIYSTASGMVVKMKRPLGPSARALRKMSRVLEQCWVGARRLFARSQRSRRSAESAVPRHQTRRTWILRYLFVTSSHLVQMRLILSLLGHLLKIKSRSSTRPSPRRVLQLRLHHPHLILLLRLLRLLHLLRRRQARLLSAPLVTPKIVIRPATAHKAPPTFGIHAVAMPRFQQEPGAVLSMAHTPITHI